ncbi:MAG: fatty acid desaturase family protein [Sporichthyaceae bacterium]
MRAVRERGHLRPCRLRYAVVIAVDLLAFCGIWAAVYAIGATWWALFLAVPAAVFTTRLMFLGHDVGHQQVARTSKINGVLQLLFGDLLSGLGSRWWIDKHSRHHANPNEVGRDPDVAPGALAWTTEQAAARRSRIGAWAARYQASLFFPMLLLEAVNLKVASFRGARSVRDRTLLLLHAGAYVGGLVLVLGPGRAAVFAVIHHALVGLHLGTAFAPNHKGMPMPEPGSRQDFLRKQVLTSRNVHGGRAVDWFLGGLNYQIEHHLFPSMPRPHLRHVQPMVRAHCANLELPYASESLQASLGLTIRHIHAAGQGGRAA